MASAGQDPTSNSSTSNSNSSHDNSKDTVGNGGPITSSTQNTTSQSTFELYDPRGILNRRRSQSRGVSGSKSPGQAGGAGTSASGTTAAGLHSRERKDSTATQSSLTSVREDDAVLADGIPHSRVSFTDKKACLAPSTGKRDHTCV